MESGTSYSESDANAVLEFWREFDLDGRRLLLDKTCAELRDSKTASINGRKRLNEVTKLFRSKAKDDQLGMMTEILKSYQEEIDQLARRSKFSETAFYGMYKSIYEAPDPAAAIENLINKQSHASTHSLEIERLKAELLQYDQEFQQLKNQDITIRRLEDQLEEYREQIEDKVMEEVNRRSEVHELEATTRVNEVKEVQRALERRLSAAGDALKLSEAACERAQSQLFDVSAQADRRVTALQTENSLLAEESLRAQARVSELETTVTALRTQLQAAQAQAATATLSSLAANTAGPSNHNIYSVNKQQDHHCQQQQQQQQQQQEFDALELIVDELRQQLRSGQDCHRAEKQAWEASSRDKLAQISRDKTLVATLSAQLAQRPTREDLVTVKRQLKLLQSVAFNVTDQDNDEDEDDDAAVQGGGVEDSDAGGRDQGVVGEEVRRAGPPECVTESSGCGAVQAPSPRSDKLQLEKLLTNRLKTVESELSDSRAQLRVLQEHQKASQAETAALQATVAGNKRLIAQLEGDLEVHTGAQQPRNKGDRATPQQQQPQQMSSSSSSSTGSRQLSSSGLHSQSHAHNQLAVELTNLLAEDHQDSAADLEQGRHHNDNNYNNNSNKQRPSCSSSSHVLLVPGLIINNINNVLENNNNNQHNNSNDQLVTVLQAQRDRYKQRMTEAETKLLSQQLLLDRLETSKTQMAEDNLSLYSQLRFMQSHVNSYSGSGGGGGGSAGGNYLGKHNTQHRHNAGHYGAYDDEEARVNDNWAISSDGYGDNNSFPKGVSADLESRYRSLYEQKLNPFAQFSMKERQQRVGQLSVADKIVLHTANAMVSSRTGRLLLLGYLAGMHILVFVTLYINAHHVHFGCDPALDQLHAQ